MRTEKLVLSESRGVNLTAYLQDVGGEFNYVTRRPAILIVPGGGYVWCSAREADPVAFPYLQAGFQVFILRYSIGENAVWPTPLEDFEWAMETIRSHADQWDLYPDKVAAIGFSAGGHLTACAASMAKHRPNAVILGYPVTLENTVRKYSATAPDAVAAVSSSTPPCFLFATRDDQEVPVENTLAMAAALDKAGASFECHIYAYGPHGSSTGDSSIQLNDGSLCRRVPDWVRDSIGWLRDVLGDFGPDGITHSR